VSRWIPEFSIQGGSSQATLCWVASVTHGVSLRILNTRLPHANCLSPQDGCQARGVPQPGPAGECDNLEIFGVMIPVFSPTLPLGGFRTADAALAGRGQRLGVSRSHFVIWMSQPKRINHEFRERDEPQVNR
jgi:hypothetical protein